jgi:hypothetical protein
MINAFLKKPYPFIFNRYSVWVPSSITFLLIIFLAPLGFSSIDFFERVIIALVIALIIAGSIHFGVIGLKKLLPSHMSEDTWTIGKEFLLYVFVLSVIILTISCVFIAVVMYQYNSINPSKIFLSVFLRTAKITFGICIIPIVVSILIEQKNYQKRQFLKANQLSEKLKKEISTIKNGKSKAEEKILFRSDNNDIELQLKFEDIMFIKSEGNYIEVHYQNKHNVAKKVIRQRIKNIEMSLPKENFFRCHNRFIVNKSFITNINGNARGLSLELANSGETINVSRTKIKALESFLVQ